jgi:hypothetical protein
VSEKDANARAGERGGGERAYAAYGAFAGDVMGGLAMTRDDPIRAGQAVKRTEALLRDARAVLRRVDVLLATALAIEDPALPEIAALRDACDRLVA